MDYITVSAKTLDDAITEALVQLGVTSDKLDYEVIEKGSAGFFGIGMKQAVIKARRKKEETVKKEVAEEKIPEIKESKPAEEKPVREKHEKHPKKDNIKKYNKKDNRRDNRKDIKRDRKEEVKEEVKVSERKELVLVPVEEATIAACKKFVEDVLVCFDMKEVTIKTEIDSEGALSINMDGSNMGLLIGKRGQTLDSLQYLTNRVANKMQDGYVRVKLDTEDYRRRRKQTLENLAKNIASKVKRTRRNVSLEPMNPYERRIIHSVLQSDPAVSTHSEGEEPYRRVVVTLVRNR
ncbi:spoIIIJ-associated protein [Lachnospiraceae bacterium MD308]|nr:spoIIIJ-associated protein [Lachnospiraceae bacterium MD308]MCI8504358.1 protein jag [Dorea sp.]